ncbi:ester cyclase [Nocardiopsis potens]|uniref:ester cyclase n=1 Tax=Nocardiopsis potens TaxID=1246458 RepID=UPI000346ACAB|nr:nuclear transport factor 2 family protein [Nocardiopsis potens]
MDETAARELYRRWLPGMWEAPTEELDRIAGELFTDDAVGHWPGRDVHGPAGIAEQIRTTHAMFTRIGTSVRVGPVVGADGLIAAQWLFTADYAEGVPGATAAPGTRVRYPGADFLRVRDGRFAEYWVVGDTMALMAQLGALGSEAG